MTPATAAEIERAEREREDELKLLLLLLLLFAGRAARLTLSAIRLGIADPTRTPFDVITGNSGLDQPGIGTPLSVALARAYRRGWRRAGLAARLGRSDPYFAGLATVPDYLDAINRRLAGALAQGMAESIREALDATQGEGVGPTVAAIRETLVRGGWVANTGGLEAPDGHRYVPTNARALALRFAYGAYNSGMADGYEHPSVGAVVTGLEWVSVLDNRTTEICRDFDGTRLPLDHYFWSYASPPAHWGCRSLILPRFSDFTPTSVPWHYPAPGFERAALLYTGAI